MPLGYWYVGNSNLLVKISYYNRILFFRQLCVMLSAEDIYRTLAELLQKEENLTFASEMVQTLSSILLTSKELFSLRLQLKDLSTAVRHILLLFINFCHLEEVVKFGRTLDLDSLIMFLLHIFSWFRNVNGEKNMMKCYMDS